MAQVFRTRFFNVKAFRDLFKLASDGSGPFIKTGPTSYVTGSGQVIIPESTRVILEPNRYNWNETGSGGSGGSLSEICTIAESIVTFASNLSGWNLHATDPDIALIGPASGQVVDVTSETLLAKTLLDAQTYWNFSGDPLSAPVVDFSYPGHFNCAITKTAASLDNNFTISTSTNVGGPTLKLQASSLTDFSGICAGFA